MSARALLIALLLMPPLAAAQVAGDSPAADKPTAVEAEDAPAATPTDAPAAAPAMPAAVPPEDLSTTALKSEIARLRASNEQLKKDNDHLLQEIARVKARLAEIEAPPGE